MDFNWWAFTWLKDLSDLFHFFLFQGMVHFFFFQLVHVPLMMNYDHLGDPLTFIKNTSSGHNLILTLGGPTNITKVFPST